MIYDREIRAYVTEKNAFTIRHGLRLNNVPPQLINTYTLNQEYNVSISRNADGVVSFINNGVETLVNVAFDSRLDTVIVLELFSKYCKVKKLQTDNHNLIPCKLLKPVPKWLDANGIRRQVGECGMIDLVSGKFYGNVNSVGTFTVENYYERKEWLKGRNGAYINTEHLVKTYEDAFEVYARYDGTNKNPDNKEQNLFGIQDNNIRLAAYINSNNDINAVIKQNEDYVNYNINIHKEVFKIALYAPNQSEYVKILDGVSYTNPIDGTVNNDTNLKMYVFARNGKANSYFHGDIAYFKITDASSNTKMNLIPCTLTMDLPASMDANNIARTKGTSGMWDLVSDKFYGNIASSGTFKAVNLAEGVDYEVHQWLIANIPIGVTMMRLFINQSSSVNYTMNITTSSNSIPLFRTAINGNKEDYVYFNSNSKLYVWNYISGTNESVNTIYSNNRLYDIELTPSEFIINSVSATKYGDAYTIVWHNNSNASTAGVTSTSKITVDCVERYIPVKLLKSIPSKYDANGIARQAGECGMYDTVNDKFYGNVASSGTFSVSDDS
jgi:hypothetical protein